MSAQISRQPEPGRVIRMRERLWRVDYVDGEIFGATALDGRDNQGRRFHSALESIGAGQMPLPSAEALGDERIQRLLLDAQRFALLHGTAPILGLQRSRAIPTDYQLVPLLMALGSDRVRIMTADDVGTGKTIEIGLALAELLARGKARRVLIVVPANLREQWRDALDHFFHIDATIVSGALLPALERRLLPGQAVWASHDVVIASVDYLKTKTAQVLAYTWDLVVIDEAHLCARPHTRGGETDPDMDRWRFAQAAAAHARHLMMATATPHNGYSDSYASLFRMLDSSLVTEGSSGPIIDRRRARAHHVVQRRRTDIEAWYEQRGVKSPFPKRDSDEIVINLTRHPEMRTLLDHLSEYTGALYGAASAPVDRWIAAHLQKRTLSSVAALRLSIRNRQRTLEKEAATTTSSAATAAAAEATADRSFLENDEGDAANLDRMSSGLDVAAELAWLERIYDTANKVTAAKDPKFQTLLTLLPKRMAAHRDAPRVLVFTKFRDTLDYLVRELNRAATSRAKKKPLPGGTQVFSIHGQMNLAQRQLVFAEFERAPIAVLVATDCISEGLNRQRACAELVHYELPWNPNRLEQRNGRVDRFQQREPTVGIRTLVLDDPLDAALLYLIYTKAEQMRKAYGFVPPFLANPDILLHLSNPGAAYRSVLQDRARSKQMSMIDEFGQIVQDDVLESLDEELAALTDANLTDQDRYEQMREESFYGQANVTLETVEIALSRSRDEIGSPERIRDFVIASIRELHGTVRRNPDSTHTITSMPAEITDTVSHQGRFSFDPEMAMHDPDIDVIDLAHPLARRLIDLTLDRAQLPECVGRVAARTSPAATGITAVAHVLFRYVAQGTPPVLLE